MSLLDRLNRTGPKKLLAIDGGGIRALLSLEVLQYIERLLAAESGQVNFRLGDYFDYIAGTSTGTIIATCLSLGMPVGDIIAFYKKVAPLMFVKEQLIERLRVRYMDEPLAQKFKELFGEGTTLGDEKLQTLLLLVMRNATTDAPWPISNNPYARFNDLKRPDCNLKIPLWQLNRASTASPMYFPPEVIALSDAKKKDLIVADGGVTIYNNPTLQMFLMATLEPYWALATERRWTTGADKMLIVSVGTGTSPGQSSIVPQSSGVRQSLDPEDMNLLFNAAAIPSALMYAALNEQDLLCRIFGDCLAGAPLDRELGALISSAGPRGLDQKLFTYVRYNAELTRDGLDRLGVPHIAPEDVQKTNAIESMLELQHIGMALAQREVKLDHFRRFPA
jgi:predicted acylesterase/phospholipase RssA